MAKLYISEYTVTGSWINSSIPIAIESSIATQVVDFTSGATQSSAFNRKTNYVRLWSDADCCLKFSNDPTADTNSLPVAAKSPEYFGVVPGAKLSVIALA
jgi:hypothetical protein